VQRAQRAQPGAAKGTSVQGCGCQLYGRPRPYPTPTGGGGGGWARALCPNSRGGWGLAARPLPQLTGRAGPCRAPTAQDGSGSPRSPAGSGLGLARRSVSYSALVGTSAVSGRASTPAARSGTVCSPRCRSTRAPHGTRSPAAPRPKAATSSCCSGRAPKAPRNEGARARPRVCTWLTRPGARRTPLAGCAGAGAWVQAARCAGAVAVCAELAALCECRVMP